MASREDMCGDTRQAIHILQVSMVQGRQQRRNSHLQGVRRSNQKSQTKDLNLA